MNRNLSKESEAQKRKRANTVAKALFKVYPDDHTALHYRDPFQLLVAVILSAQCTDVRVNLVTPQLFARFSTPHDFAHAHVKELEALIHSTGFYHNKSKNIIGCAKALLEEHQGIVPRTMEELIRLPGVGRKTANVVLGEAFGITEGVVVDTHVTRLTNRLGFSTRQDAVKIERELMMLIPKKAWRHFSHTLILHGRAVCSARSPQCRICSIKKYCPSSRPE